MIRFEEIELAIGLHARLEVIYLVDCYQAAIVRENETILSEARGETIEEAIENLEAELEAFRRIAPRAR